MYTLEDKTKLEQDIAHKYVDRFPNTNVLSAFSVFDPDQIPRESTEDFHTYVDDHIETLSDHFQQTIDKEVLQIEWLGYKEM